MLLVIRRIHHHEGHKILPHKYDSLKISVIRMSKKIKYKFLF